jgi:hypothetical protein
MVGVMTIRAAVYFATDMEGIKMSDLENLNLSLDWGLVTKEHAIPTVNELIGKIGPISLRTLHYNLVSKEIIPNTTSAYKKLSQYIVKLRKEGRISWDSIIDGTRHSIASFNDYYISPDDCIHKLLYPLGELHNEYESKILYRWYKQPCYVEVWLEKNALVGAFRKFLRGKHIRLVPNRGYGSWTFAYENSQRLYHMAHEQDRKYDDSGDIIEDNSAEKEIHILYFGDYDPLGVDMDAFQGKQIAYFVKRLRLQNVHFHRIAITKEQIRKFRLPSKPRDQTTLDKLDRDSRTNGFKEKHGGKLYAVELDALLAYRPDEFEKIVQDSVDRYYKPTIFSELAGRPEHSKEAIRRLVLKKVGIWLRYEESLE